MLLNPFRPIISTKFLERLQVDLIGLRGELDGNFKMIGHVIDNFTKFHVLFPLPIKTAEEVDANLQTHLFSYFGLAHILHSDNGREFVNSILECIVEERSGKSVLINGRPRHPKSQRCVKKAHQMRYIKLRIGVPYTVNPSTIRHYKYAMIWSPQALSM